MNHFADADILHLDLIAELNRRLGNITGQRRFREIPLEDSSSPVRTYRHDDVQRNVVGVTIQHPVGIDPKIFSRSVARGIAISAAPAALVLRPAYWTRLP